METFLTFPDQVPSSLFFLPKTKEPESYTIWTRNGRRNKPYTEMKRACKRKKEQGTHETKTEKIKKEQKGDG